MRILVGVLGWLVAAVAVLALVISGLCGVLGLFGSADFLSVALIFGVLALAVFLMAREMYRWGFRRSPPALDRSQGGDGAPPPSSLA